MSKKPKPQSLIGTRLKLDSEVPKEEYEEKLHYVDKIIESSHISLDNDTNTNIKKDIINDNNKDIKIDIVNNINKDTKNNIKKDIKKNINIVIKKDIKKDIKIKKSKSGFHCHLDDDYIVAINELKRLTGKYKDDLAQEAYELLFKKYGVEIQHSDED